MGDLADVVGPLGSSEGNTNQTLQVVGDHGIGLDRFRVTHNPLGQ